LNAPRIYMKEDVSRLTFRGPCIVIYYHNKSQKIALFLSFIFVKNSTCFGQTYCPSSGVLALYSQRLVHVIFVAVFFCVFFIPYCCVCLIRFFCGVLILICLFRFWALTNLTNTNCCEYSIKSPDDGK
jgi:hypothetical protein